MSRGLSEPVSTREISGEHRLLDNHPVRGSRHGRYTKKCFPPLFPFPPCQLLERNGHIFYGKVRFRRETSLDRMVSPHAPRCRQETFQKHQHLIKSLTKPLACFP
jgi:hypothetical protein